MKMQPIINQLRAVLPKFSTKFSDSISISSLTSSGSTATATATSHGLVTGNYVLIQGAKIPYVIESLTRVDDQATAITTNTNQIVYAQNDTVEIAGANQSDYNGTKTLVEPKTIKISSLTKSGNTITATTEEDHGFVVNSKFKIKIWGAKEAIYNQDSIIVDSTPTSTSFTYTVQGETTSPATASPQIYCQAIYTSNVFFFEVENTPITPATGTIYQLLLLNGGYNGFKSVTKIDDNSFSYTLSISPLASPAQGTITGGYASRIDGAITLQRAQSIYTAQESDDYWLFAVPNSSFTSKNRRELSDANYTQMQAQNFEQMLINSFSLYMFIPTKDSLASIDHYDDAQDELVNLLKSIVGVFIDSPLYESNTSKYSSISLLGEQIALYEKSYYVHQFNFQNTGYVQTEDIVDENDSFAFRQVEETYLDPDKEETGLENNILLP
jgi:hypothetical protein